VRYGLHKLLTVVFNHKISRIVFGAQLSFCIWKQRGACLRIEMPKAPADYSGTDHSKYIASNHSEQHLVCAMVLTHCFFCVYVCVCECVYKGVVSTQY
jgi:hypothetical protein